MKVLIVSQYFWPESFRINDLALGLKERGHEVTVLTGIPNYPGGRFYPGFGLRRREDDYQGVRVIRVPLVPRGAGGGVGLALNYLSFAVSASILGPLRLWREAFDLVYVFEISPATVGLPALVIRWLKRAPMMFWVQDLWPESLRAAGAVKSRWILTPVEWMLRVIYRGSDQILVQSRAFVDSVARLAGGAARIDYLPNTAEALYRPMRRTAGLLDNMGVPPGFRVIFAGNIGAAQDFPTLLAAAERLKAHPEIQWVIIGDGRMRPWVEQEVERRELTSSVHLVGAFPVEAMPELLAAGDALLLMLKLDEIFGLTIPSKLQSYLACGRPVLAALDGEGARVVEEAGAGLSCAAENPTDLADAVLTLSQLPGEAREAMGRRGREYFDLHFEREMLLGRIECWMHELREGTSACAS